MNYIVFAVLSVAVVAGVEYLTRGIPSLWRTVILCFVGVGWLIWLFSILGVL
jgi:hypothetical protein